MFCKNCGQNINPGGRFCKSCGAEVKIGKFTVVKTIFFRWVADHRGIIIAVLFIGALVALGSLDDSSPTTDTSSQSSSSNSDTYNPASSVVNILCTAKNSGESSGGSGTILDKNGVILTNAHVIPQVREVPSVENGECLVVLPDENTGEPREIYYATPQITKNLSKQYDIATLQIDSVYVDADGKSWGTYPNTFPEFQNGTNCDSPIKLGDSVRIYGYPVTSGGYNLTVTDGVVSSFNNDGTFLTSAKIDSGNSGGLAIDQYGCFIGIPSAVVEGNYQNLGVIIPPSLIKDFINEVPAQTDRSLLSCTSDECNFNGQCVTKPANSSCTSESSSDAWMCNSGYVESGNYCIRPTPTPTPTPIATPIERSATQLCQDNYGWNTYSDGTYCQCDSGYVWNSQQTACITRSAKCDASYPNTYWDGTYSTDGKFNCVCNTGYTWNTAGNACVY